VKHESPRALVLVSNDLASIERGSEEVFRALQAEIRSHGLLEEIKISTISSVGKQDDLPLVIVYPEGVVYGPVKRRRGAPIIRGTLNSRTHCQEPGGTHARTHR